MPRMIDDAAGRRVMEQITVGAQRAEKRRRNTQRPDRIEYTNEVNAAHIRHRMITPERGGPVPSRCGSWPPVTVQRIRLPHPVRMLAAQNAAIADQPRQRAHRIGTPTEAEQV